MYDVLYRIEYNKKKWYCFFCDNYHGICNRAKHCRTKKHKLNVFEFEAIIRNEYLMDLKKLGLIN